ncbi:unnamed protein product [Ranitomeya imitator]|uniref:Ig-like domain-containing protein n=1 Tax=Ranitomeya imitator TaxID=111125 RepID=A0ABN9L7S2_9NEOB|nr:unnamed protein product [Ranitomeya imitator]
MEMTKELSKDTRNKIVALYTRQGRPESATAQPAWSEEINNYGSCSDILDGPKNVTVLSGSNASFTCTVRAGWEVISWYLQTYFIVNIYPTGTTVSKDHTIIVQNSTNSITGAFTSAITIVDVNKSNSGVVRCSSLSASFQDAYLTVEVNGSIQITNGSVIVKPNSNVTMICQAAQWYPAPTITWQINNTAADTLYYSTSYTTAANDFVTAISTFEISPEEDISLTCLASIQTLTQPQSATVSITVREHIPGSSSSLSQTDIILIAVFGSLGGLLLIALIIVLIIYCGKKKKKKSGLISGISCLITGVGTISCVEQKSGGYTADSPTEWTVGICIMARKKLLSEEKRVAIITLRNESQSVRKIGKTLKVSPSAVAKTIKRYKEPGSHEDRPRKGRPRVTSASEDKFVRVTSLRNRRLTAAQIRDQVNATQSSSSRHISTTTVKRRLCAAGLHEHKEWTLDQWKSVLWCDESKFEIFGSNHHVFVRRRKGERMDSTCLVPTVKHGGGGVMVWGGFADDIVGDLFKIEAILNQHGYHSILQRHAIPSGLRLVGPSFIFQQDNDPKHTSRLCKGYLTKKESDGVLHQMTRPPQ